MSQIIVFGQSPLALEMGGLARELGLDACVVTLDAPSAELRLAWRGMKTIEELPADDDLRSLLASAESVILCARTDLQNLDLAFRIHDLAPGVRAVLSLAHARLSREIEHLVQSGGDWLSALSPKEVAAPAFALASLEVGVVAAFEHERQFHALVHGPAREGLVLAPDETLVQAHRLSEMRNSRDQIKEVADGLFSRARRSPDLFLTALVSLVFGVLASATVFFHFHEHLPWMTAIYFVITTFCTVGYGDISLKDSDTISKIVGIGLMLGSMLLTAALFAILTNALVQMRTDRIEGRRRFRMRNHVVVCGLGSLGFQVVKVLRHLRVKVLVIEKERSATLADELIHMGVDYVISDATQWLVLERASLRRSRALVCVMGHELTSIEVAIAGRMMRPTLPAVVRVRGDEFASRLQRHLRLHSAFSVAKLAAPFFLAKALHPRGKNLLRVGGDLQVVLAAESGVRQVGTKLVEGRESLFLVPVSDLDSI